MWEGDWVKKRGIYEKVGTIDAKKIGLRSCLDNCTHIIFIKIYLKPKFKIFWYTMSIIHVEILKV